jgi:hypothetical protein
MRIADIVGLGGAALTLGSIAFGQLTGSTGAQFEGATELRATRQETLDYTAQLEAATERAEKVAAIAEQRYESGCLLVVSSGDPSKFTALSEGKPVLDSARGSALPTGTVVCDTTGNTGIQMTLEDGTVGVGLMAFTGNTALVDEAIARLQSNAVKPMQLIGDETP